MKGKGRRVMYYKYLKTSFGTEDLGIRRAGTPWIIHRTTSILGIIGKGREINCILVLSAGEGKNKHAFLHA